MALTAREPGWAVYLANLWRATGKAAYRQLALRHLNRAIARVPDASSRPFFSHGFAGTAWAVEHLGGWFLPRGDEDPNHDVDEALLTIVEQAELPPFNFTYGLVGFGVYALERLPHPGAKRLLARILARLEQLGDASAGAIEWRLPASWNMSSELALGEIAWTGVAGGAAGVVALAGAAYRKGIARPLARRLALGGLEWLWAHRLGSDTGSVFPLHSRSATGTPWSWGAGDLGIASAMRLAASAMDLSPWQRRALRIARSIARRPPRSSRIREPTLLDGAAGVAHMFFRLHQSTGERLFADAAAKWRAYLLSLRRPGTGLAGFSSYMPGWQRKALNDPKLAVGWIGQPGFWNGVAGIGLVLLSAGGDIPADWDRALLLSYR